MSNSKLVNFTHISPYSNNPRNNAIKKITIHHVAGNASVEALGNIFDGTRKVSSNYGIGSDGRVGMYVAEKNRAWTSSNSTNDHQAITIEVANDSGAPDWHVGDKALNKLIILCTDICKRNGIKSLVYTGDKTGNLTRHNMFAATGCPGPYLQSKFPYIANEVNKRLAVNTPAAKAPAIPKSISVTTTGQKTKIEWDAVPEATGYVVYKSSKASGGYTRLTVTKSTSYITAYAPFFYKVRAYTASNGKNVYGTPSEAFRAAPTPVVKPAPVKPSELTSFMASPKLTWLNIRETPNGKATGKKAKYKNIYSVKKVSYDTKKREWYHIGIGYVAGWLCKKV